MRKLLFLWRSPLKKPSAVTDIDEPSVTVRHGLAATPVIQEMKTTVLGEGMSSMAELLTLIATLAIILVGIAVMLQATSVEEIFRFIGRAVMMFVLLLVTMCVLKYLWLCVMVPWLSAAFGSLMTLIGWLLVTIIGFIALSLVVRLVLRRFGRFLTLRRDPQDGDGYDFHDSKDTKS